MPSYEEMRKVLDEAAKEKEEREKRLTEERLKDLEKRGIKPFGPSEIPPQRCDHPNTMEDGTATVLWVAVMLVGAIFKCCWLIWIIATVVWAKFITRYKK
jgi:hypothetical protein